MAIQKYKPRSPGRRAMSRFVYRGVITKRVPEKSLTKGGKRFVGRNNAGRVTVRHKGGGHKKVYRLIDFKFDKKDIPAKVASVEYDPFRSAFIGLAVYRDGEKRYVVVPKTVSVGHEFLVSEKAPLSTGNRLPLSSIPVGTFIYCVALKPGGKANIARSAGNYAQVIAQDGEYAHVKLPSSEVRKIHGTCWASVGEVSNEEHRLVSIGKAGRTRWKGIRPTVRGSVMNPVDHPHGGGEGRQGRGLRRAKSMWGKPTGKGQKTRRPKKYSNVFIVSRRKVGKRK